MTHRGPRCVAPCCVRGFWVCVFLGVQFGSVHGQVRVPVNADTRVGSVGFTFSGSLSFTTRRLEDQLALPSLRAPSLLRRIIGWLPGVDSPESGRFDPLELQQDVARLRQFYGRAGFPSVEISYDLTLHADNKIDIVFSVEEGDPVVMNSVSYVWSEDGVLGEPPGAVAAAWETARVTRRLRAGDRADDFEIAAVGREVADWLANRGYPFARASSDGTTDSSESGDVVFQITPGARARVASVAVEGNERVSTPVIERELGLHVGEWYSAADFREGEAQVLGLDIIRSAVTDFPEGAVVDSAVAVRLRVSEGKLRLMSGGAGYVSESGVAFQGQWDHRDFTGGARVLSVAALGETGALALDDTPDVLYRSTISLRQPYFGSRRLSLLGSAEAEYRDDLRDESWAVAAEGSLIYERGPLQALALSYRLESRKLLDGGLGALAPEGAGISRGSGDEREFGDVTDHPNSGVFSLTAFLGHLDNLREPTRGFTFRPSLEYAGPASFNTTEYVRIDAVTAGFVPITRRSTFMARLSAGRLFPFGKSVPAPGESGLLEFNDLRNVVFTVGGGADVRGWDNGLLGPKIPDSRVDSTTTEPQLVGEGRYMPVGGLARVAATLEARLPFPGVSDNLGVHLFVDGGRVWTPDDRYSDVEDYFDEDDFFFAAGGGLDLSTPVGLVRASIGMKLNPSLLDLRDPDEVLAALVVGTPISDVPESWGRRLKLHLTIGQVF